MNEAMASVLESLKAADLEAARKKVEAIGQTTRTERDRGALAAASGILTSISKGKEGALQTWSEDKVARAADMVKKSQMADDWDRGYADVLSGYAKLLKKAT